MSLDDLDWRDIPGFDGMYQISRMAQVRSWRWRGTHRAKRPKLLTPYIHNKNATGTQRRQLWVKLTKPDGTSADYRVHILMRDVWMGGPRPGMVVYHKNGDIQDPCLHNLGFISRKELGRKTGSSAKRIPVVKLTPAGEIVACYPSARAAAKANHMSYQAVIDRCNGKVKKPYALDGHTYAYDR